MGSKTAEKRNSAVVIPQRLRPQEKSKGHPRCLPLSSVVLKGKSLGAHKLHRYIKEKGQEKAPSEEFLTN